MWVIYSCAYSEHDLQHGFDPCYLATGRAFWTKIYGYIRLSSKPFFSLFQVDQEINHMAGFGSFSPTNNWHTSKPIKILSGIYLMANGDTGTTCKVGLSNLNMKLWNRKKIEKNYLPFWPEIESDRKAMHTPHEAKTASNWIRY